MEVKHDEEPYSFTNITVKYEFREHSAEVPGHCSDAVGFPLGTHVDLTVDHFEDCQGKTTNGDPIAIVPESYDSGDYKNSGNSEVTVQEKIDDEVERSLDDKNFRLTLLKNEECFENEERYIIVSERAPERNENLSVSSAQSLRIIPAKQIPGDEIIEIDDSSGEETLEPLVSSAFTIEGLTLPQFQSAQNAGSSNVDKHPSPVPTQSDCTALDEDGFKAFEDAMDDWYSKLSFHGPLKDCEIMESARQLAERFNFEFPEDAAWLEDFKNRQECKTKTRRGPNRMALIPNQRGRTSDSSKNRRKKSNSGPTPSSKARKKGKTLADLNREDVDYPLLLISARNGRLQEDELVVSKPKKRAPPVKKKGTVAVENHMEIQKINVGKCHSVSVEIDQPLDGASTEMFSVLEDPIKPSAGDEAAVGKFESVLLHWYLSLTSKHKIMVAAAVFENMAVKIAREQNLLDFQPTKVWLKMFLGHHGMWCRVERKRSIIKEPEGGLLKGRFDLEFEVWYHAFPTSPDQLLDDYEELISKPELRLKLKNYLVAVFDWYVAQSSYVSSSEILTAEANIAEMAGLSGSHVHLVTEFYRNYCIRHKEFYESVKGVYSHVPVLLPNVLRPVALGWARKYQFRTFVANELWMKRFLELNGLCLRENGVSSWYMFDSSTCRNADFERFFRRWFRASLQCGDDTQSLVENLQALFNKKHSPEEPVTPLKIEHSFTLQESNIEHSYKLQEPKIEPSYTLQEPKVEPSYTLQEPKFEPSYTLQEPEIEHSFTLQEPFQAS